MSKQDPGKSYREGISLIQLMEMFPDNAAAEQWFEETRWGGDRYCPHCGSTKTLETKNRSPMPYWCSDCRSYFSVRTGSPIESSRVPYRKWVLAIYLHVTSLKGVSAMKLHRDLDVAYKTAWFMLHRIREARGDDKSGLMEGPVEADETYVGGKRKNMPKSKRKELTGRGAVGKAAVVGVKDLETKKVRARVVREKEGATVNMQGFLSTRVRAGGKVYTDEATSYRGLIGYQHETVNHSRGEYVRGEAGTQGIESFWSMFKRAYVGTYHKMSPKHLNRYVQEFAGRQSIRERNAVQQMRDVVAWWVGKRLLYRDLTA